MSATAYFPFFIITMAIFAFAYSSKYITSPDYRIQENGNNSIFITLIICVILIIWMGNRPISAIFGDTVSYSRIYALLQKKDVSFDWESEWLWSLIMQTCHGLGMSVSGFFTVIEFGYIISIFLAICILMPKNILLGMLFVLVSFSFFTFGVNGLRNGLAVHIVLLGIALFLSDKKIISYLLFLGAFGIHRSVILPLMSFFSSVYIIKNPKISVIIWMISIPISLISGYFFVGLFSSLGFDDRMSQYLTVGEGNALHTSTSAFRWDFLLYSAMPVLMTWFVYEKEKVTDTWFNVISSTYCLSNAFWILVIRASFTNRFAYLSWFIYPIVIAYPLIMLPIWKDQDNKTGIILIAYSILTLGICYFTGMI